MSTHGKVLMAMSGGVDSSAAAVMLREQGYEVVGITMKTWDYATSGGAPPLGKEVGCCTLDAMNDARAVALRHGFTHFIVDIREEFGDWVVQRFADDYFAGRTPNPCVLCNTHIKWTALLRRADALGCAYIATGHYARTRRDSETGRTVLMKGRDAAKDQSYVLWGLPQAQLARSLFPLGDLHKPEVRRRAEAYGLAKVAGKRDSYEICFIPDNDYRGFLRRREPELDARVGAGPFLLRSGRRVGTHEGYPYYTIGQRHGLGLALGRPVYVTRIDAATNTVWVGPKEELLGQTLTAAEVNMVQVERLEDERTAWGKIRYKDEGAPCVAAPDGDALRVTFAAPRRAITPGQSLVLYDGDDVLAGGWIRSVDGLTAEAPVSSLPYELPLAT